MGASAPDIITYIGVPLAVLGVAPIFWLAYRALIKKLKLLRAIDRSHLPEISTRAEILSGVVYVDFYQYRLEVPSRDEELYWTKSLRSSSAIEGDSWACLHWREPKQRVKNVSHRLQYSDPLRLPRAKIDFDALLISLIDRGARIQESTDRVGGFQNLRANGRRTVAGTKLLFGLDDSPLLEVAVPFDDEFEELVPLSINRKNLNIRQDNRSRPNPESQIIKPLIVPQDTSAEQEKAGQLPLRTETLDADPNFPESSLAPGTDMSALSSEVATVEKSNDDRAPAIKDSSLTVVQILNTNEDIDITNTTKVDREPDSSGHPKVIKPFTHIYSVILGSSSIKEITSQRGDQPHSTWLSMQIPQCLDVWFYAAVKSLAVQRRQVCRYLVPSEILSVLRNDLKSRCAISSNNVRLTKILIAPPFQHDELMTSLRKIIDAPIRTGLDIPTYECLELISTMEHNLNFVDPDDNGLALNQFVLLALSYVDLVNWHRVSEMNATFSDIIGSLLHEMVADESIAERVLACVRCWAYGDFYNYFSKHREDKELRGTMIRATLLYYSMLMYLTRDGEYEAMIDCFNAYPVVLLG